MDNTTAQVDETSNLKKTAKQNKRRRKKSKEMEGEKVNSIKNFFKYEDKKGMNASTPTSVKNRSPPSATKPQVKQSNSKVNTADNCTKENEEEYLSAMD